MTILILHIVTSKHGFLFSSPEDCVPTLKDHIVEAKQQWVCQGNYKEYTMQILLKRFKLQASSFKTAEAWSDYSKWFGLSTGRNPNEKTGVFLHDFFGGFFAGFFPLQQVKHKVATFLVVCEIVGETEKKGHVESGIPDGLSRCLIRKLVEWCAYVSIYVFKTLSKTKASL